MRTIISFKFVTPVYQKDLSLLQNSSILKQINLFHEKKKHIHFLQNEIVYLKIEERLQQPSIQKKIYEPYELFKNEVCSDIPNAFWQRKKHIVSLPYEKDFSEKNISTKARPIQMNKELLEFCKKEIETLLKKGLITPSKSPCSCAAFYVNNQAEKERGVPR